MKFRCFHSFQVCLCLNHHKYLSIDDVAVSGFLIWNMDKPTNRNAPLTINNKLIEVIVVQIKYFSKNSFWVSLSICCQFYYYESFNDLYTIVVLGSFEARSFLF